MLCPYTEFLQRNLSMGDGGGECWTWGTCAQEVSEAQTQATLPAVKA